MIKLTDLLKELDLRKGQLRGVINDDIMYNYFAVDFDIAEEDLDDVVDETPLYGDKLIDDGWYGNGKHRSWTAQGWSFICICRIEEIELTE